MIRIYNVVGVLFIFLLTSCSEDYLNRPPLGIQTEDNLYDSPGAAFKMVTNCYLGFYDFWGYQAALAELGNMATDESEKGGSDAGDRPFVADLGFGRTLSSNETLSNFWSACYKAIGNCNVALDNLPEAELLDDDGNLLEESKEKRYLAEIRFLRSYFYFDLVRVFGGVPLITTTPSVDDRDRIERARSEEIFNFIESEWTEIADDLPSKGEMSDSELGRVSKEAVWAFLAKAYLFFADGKIEYYEKARDFAKKVIDSEQFKLENNYQDLWLQEGYKSDESIFMVIFGDDPGSFIYGSTLPVYCSPRSVGGWGFDCLTQSLVDEFEDGDSRRLFTVLDDGDIFPTRSGGQEKLDFSVSPGTGYYNRKVFLIDGRRGQGWGDDEWTLYLMRYSDVLLMYAEALLESGGNHEEIVEYINKVRMRVNQSDNEDVEAIDRKFIVSGTLSMVDVSDDLRTAIRHERRVEFGGEYHRLFDLIRWGNYVTTMHDFSKKPYSNGRGSAFKESSGSRYVFPIPQVEIDRSGGSITQNPGY